MDSFEFDNEILAALTSQDSMLGPLFSAVLDKGRFGKGVIRPRSREPLEALIRTIIGQQLSIAASATIYSRLLSLLPMGVIEPNALLRLPHDAFKSAGLSTMKTHFIRNVCAAVKTGSLDLSALESLPDSEAAARLKIVSGIGDWTAAIYLIFQLGRPDVLPCTDVGIQRGVQLAYGFVERPSSSEVERLGINWQPYRSLVARFLWAAINERISDQELKSYSHYTQ